MLVFCSFLFFFFFNDTATTEISPLPLHDALPILALLAKVKRTGRPILVPRKGEPIAQIIPPPPPKRPESWLGSLSKTGKIIGDIVSPAVPEHEWEASRR